MISHCALICIPSWLMMSNFSGAYWPSVYHSQGMSVDVFPILELHHILTCRTEECITSWFMENLLGRWPSHRDESHQSVSFLRTSRHTKEFPVCSISSSLTLSQGEQWSLFTISRWTLKSRVTVCHSQKTDNTSLAFIQISSHPPCCEWASGSF